MTVSRDRMTELRLFNCQPEQHFTDIFLDTFDLIPDDVGKDRGEVVDVFLLLKVANVELNRLTNEVTLGGGVGLLQHFGHLIDQ